MILRFLGSTWALIAVWTIGPAILIYLRRRAKQRQEAARGPQARKQAAPDAERETAVMPAPAFPPREVPPGFREMKWDDPPSADMQLANQTGDEAVYTRPKEALRIEDVPVEAIHYIFTSGKLAAVRVDAPIHAGDPLLRALSQQWGAPDTQDPRAAKQQWTHLVSGPMATAAVLERNPASRRATLFLFRKAEKRPAV